MSTQSGTTAEKLRKTQLGQLELSLFGSTSAEKPDPDSDEQSTDEEDNTEDDKSGSDAEADLRRREEKKRQRMTKRIQKLVTEPPTKKQKKDEAEAVWSDDDDNHQTLTKAYLRENAPDKLTAIHLSDNKLKKYSSKIREQFVQRSKLGQKPEWLSKLEEEKTEKSQEDDEESDEEDALEGLFALQKTTGKYLGRPAHLPRTYLQANKLPDPTLANRKPGKKVKVVLFHPSEPVLITANTSGAVQLHQVCRSPVDLQTVRTAAFLQEMRIKQFKVDSLSLFADATSMLLSSNRNDCFYEYDLMSGKVNEHTYPKNIYREKRTGLRSRLSADNAYLLFLGQGAELHLFARAALEHLHTFVAPAHLVDARFAPHNRDRVFGLCASGEVLVWDLKAKAAQHIFRDQGCVRATCMQISKNEQFLAIGQNTGIVNVYEMKKVLTEADPIPLQTYTNLTTSVSFLSFSHDSEMLAMGSDEKPMAYRIAHVRSSTVFNNFPPKAEMLSKAIVSCADFSPHSGFVAFGTTDGNVRLYRLTYFDKY